MSTNDWLQQLKAGDTVAISGRLSPTPTLGMVDRATATQIVLAGNARFVRKDGREHGVDDWARRVLLEPTQDVVRAATHARLVAKLRRVQWDALPLETLESVATLLPKLTSVS